MSPLVVALLVSVSVSAVLSLLWVHGLDRRDARRRASLEPVVLPVWIGLAAAHRRKSGRWPS